MGALTQTKEIRFTHTQTRAPILLPSGRLTVLMEMTPDKNRIYNRIRETLRFGRSEGISGEEAEEEVEEEAEVGEVPALRNQAGI